MLELREVGDQAGEGVGGQHLGQDEHENWEEEGQEEFVLVCILLCRS